MSTTRADRLSWVHATFGRYEPHLFRYARRILGDPERARDVVQDTFLRLLQTEKVERGRPVEDWLFTVCRNRALDERRRDQRARRVAGPDTGAQQGAGPSAVAAVERRSDLDHVRAALRALPPRQREVLRLRFDNGWSYKQIGAETGLTASHVGYLLHVAIKTLRDELRTAGVLETTERE
jgi:RNA polymerase sigma-70 factor (ECF subfamily)